MNSERISRRTALGTVAAAGVAASLDGGTAAGQDRDRTIDIGLITEPTASHRTGYLSVLAQCRGVRKVAVADGTGATAADSRKRLGDRFGGFHQDPRRLLDQLNPELTVITLEAHRTPAAVTAALEAGSHVLVEKPGCVELADFEQVVKLAAAKQRQVMLAMATRSAASVKRARQLIVDGTLGTFYSTTMNWIADQTRLTSPAYHKAWMSFKDRAGGGKLIFHGVHYLDVIQHLVGDSIRDVSSLIQNVGGQPIEVEDAAVVNFRMTHGMLGTLNTGYYLDKGKQLDIRIWGSHGWLQLDFRGPTPLQWYTTRGPKAGTMQQFADKTFGYLPFFQEAVDAVRGRGDFPITRDESLRALRVVFAAYQAAESRKTQAVG